MKAMPLMAAVMLGAAVVLVPTAASAASPSVPTDPNGDYCASQITADGAMSSPECFDTLTNLDAYLADEGVAVSSSAPQLNAPIQSAATSSAAGEVVLGTVYKNANLSGASLTLFGSGSVCDGVDYGFSSLASGWNDSISSGAASVGCWMTMYDQTSYKGDKITCTPVCDSVGSLLNDKVKSLVFKPTGQFG